jgi:putative SOS response-associated peptidase YedK
MCSHYESVKKHETLKSHFKIDDIPDGIKEDLWPGYLGAFIRNTEPGTASPEHELLLGSFGLIPHWATDTKISRHTYNARSETVAEKPSYRDAWRLGRRCIIPADAFYEPDWRTGKAIPTRISRVDGKPMGIAGLWTGWKSPSGDILRSYTMLTINADTHPLMRLLHKPTDEKRMVVILTDDQYDDWLSADQEESKEFLREYPAELLTAELK